MFLLRLSGTLSLVVAISTLACGQHIVDLYRPLYESQRGPLLEPKSGNVSQACVNGFNYLLFNKTKTVLSALDAFGKLEPGFLVGNWAWLGHFTECSNLKDYHYCLLTLEVDASSLNKSVLLEDIPIQWGVCAPNDCTKDDVHNSVYTLLDFLHLGSNGLNLVNVSAAVTCVDKPVVPYGAGFIAGIVQSGDIEPLLANSEDGHQAVNGGGHRIQPLHQMQTGWRRFLSQVLYGVRLVFLDFALNRNLGKLMKIGKANERNIDCLNGIRVLSMFWVILGHIFFFPVTYGGLFNIGDAMLWTKNFAFQVVLNAYFSVDSFFFLSGLLVCYITLLKLDKRHGKLPWHWFYLHRYIRLTPVMLTTILIWMYIAPYTLWGPKAALMAKRPFCPQYWWANVFYIQNFYPAHFGQSCIAWTWYLANDMQFFLISPLIIFALYRAPLVGFGLIGSLLAMSFSVTGFITAKYNLPASPTANIETPSADAPDVGNLLYQKPYVRIPPYLVGMVLGYALYRLKDRQFTINRALLALGWFVATAIALLTLFGLYGNSDSHPLGKAGNVVYEMFSRFAWECSSPGSWWPVNLAKQVNMAEEKQGSFFFSLVFIYFLAIILFLGCYSWKMHSPTGRIKTEHALPL
ncbi:putative nose resistant to fluoxetine protein 6 [Apostichopus japonicus]|uniref:Putative nose resistant to fluoxetine protein 6 n=1 Tax=Stichopus japonicus TaxID=307972 RepID=A0A2G8KG13_STIJA|nr:putative nose resistant to fluoxetine protein 6 [Apostichopus japonicus]